MCLPANMNMKMAATSLQALWRGVVGRTAARMRRTATSALQARAFRAWQDVVKERAAAERQRVLEVAAEREKAAVTLQQWGRQMARARAATAVRTSMAAAVAIQVAGALGEVIHDVEVAAEREQEEEAAAAGVAAAAVRRVEGRRVWWWWLMMALLLVLTVVVTAGAVFTKLLNG